MDDVLRDEGFWLAFVAAALAAAVSVPLAHRAGVRRSYAVVLVVASAFAAAVDDGLTLGLVFGVLLVAAAGYAHERPRGALPVTALLVTGAVFVVSTPSGIASWMRVVGLLAVVVVVPGSAVADRRAPRLLPVVALITVIGVYVCVPDTELALMLLGAALPAVLFALDPAAVASPWTGAVVAVVVEAVLVGGAARPGAIVGGLACVGVLVLVPLAAWMPSTRRDGVVLLVTHAALVLWVARVAGLRDSAWAAAALCVPAFAIAWCALFVTARIGRRRERQ